MFALFKKNGHFDSCLGIEPKVLPDGWFALPVDSNNGCMWSDGKTVYYPDSEAPSEDHIWSGNTWVLNNSDLIGQARAEKLQQLNTAAQQFVNAAAGIDKVPDFELRTWAIQAAEAHAWAADQFAPTPVLDQIAASRGMAADKLKAAALRKALAYEQLTAHVAGQRQAFQVKIEAAKTQTALDKIVIEFTAPQAV